jgi:hypothetical protein
LNVALVHTPSSPQDGTETLTWEQAMLCPDAAPCKQAAENEHQGIITLKVYKVVELPARA